MLRITRSSNTRFQTKNTLCAGFLADYPIGTHENREIRRRARVIGAFPDGNSALMLVSARLRHVASTAWRTKRYMSMKYLDDAGVSWSNPYAG